MIPRTELINIHNIMVTIRIRDVELLLHASCTLVADQPSSVNKGHRSLICYNLHFGVAFVPKKQEAIDVLSRNLR